MTYIRYADRVEGICIIRGCGRRTLAKQRCRDHWKQYYYQMQKKRRKVLQPPLAVIRGCSMPKCPYEHKAKGLCAKHYLRLWRHGSPQIVLPHPPPVQKPKGRICSLPGCDEPHASKGVCSAHGRRIRKYGDPMLDKPIRHRLRMMCVMDCGKRASAGFGYCHSHYMKWRRWGDPLGKQTIA